MSLQQPTAPQNKPVLQVESLFQGPIPPPSLLEGYNKIVPGSADRIISMAESQVQHRHEMEKQQLQHEIKLQNKGQWFGFILGSIVVVGSFYAIILGKSIAGLTSLLTTLSAFVGVYIFGQKQSRKNFK